MTPILLVSDKPTYEDNLMGPFQSREGMVVRKCLIMAGIPRHDCYFAFVCGPKGDLRKEHLWEDIQRVEPKVIVALGQTVTRVLLKASTKLKFCDLVGEFKCVDYSSSLVAPWYHPSYLLNHGIKIETKTIKFLIQVREKVNV